MKKTKKQRRVEYQTAYMDRQKAAGKKRICRLIPAERVEEFSALVKKLEKKWKTAT